MKLSPYFRVFEEEANTWEEKLNRINNLFDVWIDVQRRWVYLEGIFSGNADIANLLPVETSRFNSISAEFLTLMKKVAKSTYLYWLFRLFREFHRPRGQYCKLSQARITHIQDLPKKSVLSNFLLFFLCHFKVTKSRMVMDVLNIQGIQRSLERLADLLSKVQKALGEYLERERASFPRFYFVGDEDLLEIIGNSKNLPRLQKHFKKMFAGMYVRVRAVCARLIAT